MPVYLYCVVAEDAPEPTLSGIDAAPLRVLRAGGVAVWLADVERAPAPDLDRIREHDNVVRAALEAGFTPVPIRYGQVLASDAEVRAHLAAHDYAQDLARVRDCVEFGIRIVDPDTSVERPDAREPPAQGGSEARSGAAYMKLLAARVHAAERTQARAMAAARALDAALAEHVRASRVEPSERPPGAVVAHLVQASSRATYAARARELSHTHPPLRIVVTGPWPPYSFVGT